MGALWIVHSGAEELGPWSASRIRDELRAGRIDAFDRVSVVGSSVKRPLIEVDEIFENSRIQAAAIVNESPPTELMLRPPVPMVARAAGAEEVPRFNKTHNSPPTANAGQSNEPPYPDGPSRPRAFEALASPDRLVPPSRPAIPLRRSSPTSGARRYVLMTPERKTQGPFSSKEVLALWYGQKLAPSTMVQRLGDSKRIEITRFVGFYERAEPSGIAFIVGTRMASQARDRAHWWFVFAIILAAAMILGSIAYRSGRLSREFLSEIMSTQKTKVPSQVADEPKKRAPVNTGFQPLEPVVVTPSPAPSVQNPPPKPPVKKDSLPKKAQVSPKNAAKYAREVKRSPRPKYSASAVAKSSSVPLTPPNPAVNAVAKPVAKPQPTSTKPAATGFVDGSVVTLSGYRFNIGLLNACTAKCKIPMSGSQGPVTAVFFKDAFGAALATKANGVTLVGTLRKDQSTGAIQIFVQSVR